MFNFEITKMPGLLKPLKHTYKKDKLDTGTLPNPDGPLSSSSSTEITNIHVCQVQQEALSKRRSQGPYISLTLAQKFLLGNGKEQLKTP